MKLDRSRFVADSCGGSDTCSELLTVECGLKNDVERISQKEHN